MNNHAIQFDMMGSGKEFCCYIKIEGDLTHEDYEFFVPEFENTIKNINEPHIKLIADITKLKSWDIHAAWDDSKFGLNHSSEFSKIAVIGQSSFYEYGTKISNWFIPCELKYFESFDEAKSWLFY